MGLSRIDQMLALLALAELVVFGLFWFDKAQARGGGWRVRESTLLTASIFGGLGAWFGQHILRHKTCKEPFRTLLGLTILVHLAAVAGVFWWLLT